MKALNFSDIYIYGMTANSSTPKRPKNQLKILYSKMIHHQTNQLKVGRILQMVEFQKFYPV